MLSASALAVTEETAPALEARWGEGPAVSRDVLLQAARAKMATTAGMVRGVGDRVMPNDSSRARLTKCEEPESGRLTLTFTG